HALPSITARCSIPSAPCLSAQLMSLSVCRSALGEMESPSAVRLSNIATDTAVAAVCRAYLRSGEELEMAMRSQVELPGSAMKAMLELLFICRTALIVPGSSVEQVNDTPFLSPP